MHSSGMCTAHLLTISQHALHRGCVSQHALGRGMCVSQHALDRAMCISQHALGRGVCIPACTGQGVCIPACTGQGGVYPSMHWAGCVPAWRVYLPGGGFGVYLPEGLCQHAMGRHPPVDRQTPVKT